MVSTDFRVVLPPAAYNPHPLVSDIELNEAAPSQSGAMSFQAQPDRDWIFENHIRKVLDKSNQLSNDLYLYRGNLGMTENYTGTSFDSPCDLGRTIFDLELISVHTQAFVYTLFSGRESTYMAGKLPATINSRRPA